MLEDGRCRPSHLRLYTLIGLMTTMWSFNYIVAKFALREFPPLLASGIRTCLAGIMMIPVYIAYSRRGLAGFERSDVPKLLSIGILGVGLNQVLFVSGIARTSVAHAAVMIALAPILVLVLASAGGQERLGTAKLAGLLVAIGGVFVLQLASRSDRGSSLTGDLLIVGAAVSFAIFSVSSKAHAGRLSGVTMNTFAYVGSGIALLPIVVAESAGFSFRQVTWVGWISLLYMALFSSVIAYVIFFYALRHIPASRVTAFSYLQPLLATLMAIPILGEQPTTTLATGGAMVLCGVFLAERA